MREDEVLLGEGPDAQQVMYLPCVYVSAHQFRVRWWYLVDGVDVDPQMNFWRQLGWDIVENTLYK